MSCRLAVIVPCYNEQDVLEETSRRLSDILHEMMSVSMISKDSFILFVDDGSRDKTWGIIESLSFSNKHIKGLKLSRNCGHQNALMAGLEYAVDKSDCMVTIDADLQDDPLVMKEMVSKFLDGKEIIYAVRNSRDCDSFLKKWTALGFYYLMKWMGADVVFNHADYRLMSKRAVQYLLEFKERNLFLRGIIPLIGLKTDVVYYERQKRYAGESKYPFRKMLSFALDGITSFSVVPLRMVFATGVLFFLVSLVGMLYVLYVSMFTTRAVPGWASVLLSIYLVGGVQLISTGVIGEYLAKVYKETKMRPRYFIDRTIE